MTSASTPAKTRTGLILALLSATYFMVILDAAIVRLAIPPIQRDLHLSAGAETWVANGYMLTFGSLLLLGGRAIRAAARRCERRQRRWRPLSGARWRRRDRSRGWLLLPVPLYQ
jgi:MFS family permease